MDGINDCLQALVRPDRLCLGVDPVALPQSTGQPVMPQPSASCGTAAGPDTQEFCNGQGYASFGCPDVFVQSAEFIQAHASGRGNTARTQSDTTIYGQETNHTIGHLAQMNLMPRGITGQTAQGNTFHNDRPPGPNVADWGGKRLIEDRRWRQDILSRSNDNCTWVQSMLHSLVPRGTVGFVLASGSMSSHQSNESEIRKNPIEADLVDCRIALPGHLFHFFSRYLPASGFWPATGTGEASRTLDGSLSIEARRMGCMMDRTRKELTAKDMARIADACRAWWDKEDAEEYAAPSGFGQSATLEEIRRHGYVPTPGCPVLPEDDGESFANRMAQLAAQGWGQQTEANRLDAAIRENMKRPGLRLQESGE